LTDIVSLEKSLSFSLPSSLFLEGFSLFFSKVFFDLDLILFNFENVTGIFELVRLRSEKLLLLLQVLEKLLDLLVLVLDGELLVELVLLKV
jgi:hypothetical protein